MPSFCFLSAVGRPHAYSKAKGVFLSPSSPKALLNHASNAWFSGIQKSRRGPARSAAAWLGRPDLNRRLAESKSAALPLGYTPIQNYIIEGPDRSPTKWIRFGKEEGVSVVQFSPRGGNGTVLALRGNQIEAQRSEFDLERKKESA